MFMSRRKPRFMVRAQEQRFAVKLAEALGVPSVVELRKRYKERGKSAEKMYEMSRVSVTLVEPGSLGTL